MATSFEKLQTLLSELFQLDQADLDFGIYRIMNQKRDEITRFLNKELLPQVKTAFAQYHPADKRLLEEKLEEARQAARTAGFDPEESPKVKEIREQMANYSVDTEALENEVYSHLYSFFRRYYDAGDFISMRRYKEGVYAIPYEGEEVKLHWANADQYYIKTAEYFRDYTFKLPSGRTAHFKIAEADVEKDNVKAAEEKDRRFILASENAVQVANEEIIIRFEYRVDGDKRKQEALNAQAIADVLASPAGAEWVSDLNGLAPSGSNPRRTVLEKHLSDYTARNTFDYFIHKNLRGFLRRELDFYIKNEVMRLDDIENETAPRVEQYLSKVKALRLIAHKIIEFLAQIEDFQKKLWLKKKFVVETNYCITLDCVPEELYPEIAANDAQREEWVRLFAIDEIKGDLVTPGYSVPLSVKFLKSNQFLVLDTKYISENLKSELINSIEDIEAGIDGLLIQSENFQSLNILSPRFNNQIECIYIDPPYNTDGDRRSGKFLYKDNYEHSTWISMLNQSIDRSYKLLKQEGAFFASCDENEFLNFGKLLVSIFGEENHTETITWNKRVPKNDKGVGNIHEYIYLFSKDQKSRTSKGLSYVMLKDGLDEIFDLVEKCKRNNIPLEETQRLLKDFYKKQGFDRGITLYCELDNDYEIWGKINMSWPNPQTEGPRYEVINPITGKPVPVPKKGWRWTEATFQDAEKDGKEQLLFDGSLLKGRIWYSPNENVQPSSATYLKEVKTFLLRSIVSLKSDGSLALEDFGLGSTVDYPKPIELMDTIIFSANFKEGYCIDFYAGSGTTGQAVINLNREDSGKRKYILVEMGNYFDTVTKPRIQKIIYSQDWKEGKPISRKGSSHCFKYLKVESYEDVLNNLVFNRTEAQQLALEQSQEFRENYFLSYMLDTESQQALLNINSFSHPFEYKMNITSGAVGESKPTNIDLVETFNYLIGLQVKTMQTIRGYKVVTGLTPEVEHTLIIWRDLTEKSNADLEEFFRKQDYNPRDMEFDLIYVNGDNNLENLRRPNETWKVRLIEDEFLRLMFDTEGL